MTLREFLRKHLPIVPREWMEREAALAAEKDRKATFFVRLAEEQARHLTELRTQLAPALERTIAAYVEPLPNTAFEVRVQFFGELARQMYVIGDHERAMQFLAGFVAERTLHELRSHNPFHQTRGNA